MLLVYVWLGNVCEFGYLMECVVLFVEYDEVGVVVLVFGCIELVDGGFE